MAPVVAEIPKKEEIATPVAEPSPKIIDNTPKVSAFSLASIRAKKEIEAQQNQQVRNIENLPKEAFTETEMRLQWNNFAMRLADRGEKLMETYMTMNTPVLNETTIVLEVPNESIKVEFLSKAADLVGYLRGKLHNHDITIELVVNEMEKNNFRAFTPQDKYERLKAINPALELLRKTFELDL